MTSHTFLVAGPTDVDEMLEIDDDASRLYRTQGYDFDWPHDHPMVQAELARWRRAAAAGLARLAKSERGTLDGFVVWGWLDGRAYLDQLSVRLDAMRLGLGGRLVRATKLWAQEQGETELWLTTYAHLPWNATFYERLGFERVEELQAGPGIRAVLKEQRRWLPNPELRIAMRCALH